MDMSGLVAGMIEDGAFSRIVNNPMAQFGPVTRQYLGAQILPERTVPENSYTEESIRYRTVIANDGTRYSPVQLKRGLLQGNMHVVLGDSDIGSHFTSADYDAVIRLLQRSQPAMGGASPFAGQDRPSMTAVQQMTNWADATLNLPLVELCEVQRWQAIVNAQVIRQGDGGYAETVGYPNPPGHRVTAAGQWSNDAYDPYSDFMAAQIFLATKGFTIGRIIASQPVIAKLQKNINIRQRLGLLSVAGGLITGLAGHASLAAINNLLNGDNLPGLEHYDLQYRTQTGSNFFLPRNVCVMIATTGRDESIDRGDLEPLLVENVLGYHGIGRAAGQSTPGRAVVVNTFGNKPPRVEGEAWQTHLPVITEPEGVYVISGIS